MFDGRGRAAGKRRVRLNIRLEGQKWRGQAPWNRGDLAGRENPNDLHQKAIEMRRKGGTQRAPLRLGCASNGEGYVAAEAKYVGGAYLYFK